MIFKIREPTDPDVDIESELWYRRTRDCAWLSIQIFKDKSDVEELIDRL